MWLARLTPAVSPSCHALWLCGRVSVLTPSRAGHTVEASGSSRSGGGRGEWPQ